MSKSISSKQFHARASCGIRSHKEDKMADWDEIKRLAADFQRVQVTSTAHKLSERNCVEIVQKLISLNLLEVIYTTDGKEYLTPQQLEKEIKDELFIRGGGLKIIYFSSFQALFLANLMRISFLQDE